MTGWVTSPTSSLATIHRFTPQILSIIKHVHHHFPTLDLGQDWNIDFTRVESARADGPLPVLISAGSRAAEESDIVRAVHELYPAGRLALAVVDTRQWARFSDLASRIGNSAKFHVSTISGRSEIDGFGYRRHGLIVGPSEYLAGLQFDSVLVAGIPDLNAALTSNEQIRLLSLLYLHSAARSGKCGCLSMKTTSGLPKSFCERLSTTTWSSGKAVSPRP